MPVQSFPKTNDFKQRLLDGSYCDSEFAAYAIDEVLACYDESHRAYHTRQHLEEMFELLDSMVNDFGLDEREMTIMALAIFYHDVIYKTDTPENILQNEEASALFAQRDMIENLGIKDQDMVDHVTRIIRATKDHVVDPSQDILAALVIDIDMAILGRDEARYKDYTAQVRQEFSAFPDDVFYQARRDHFLLPQMQKQRVFLTPEMEEAYGVPAKRNMHYELQAIEANPVLKRAPMPK